MADNRLYLKNLVSGERFLLAEYTKSNDRQWTVYHCMEYAEKLQKFLEGEIYQDNGLLYTNLWDLEYDITYPTLA